MKTEDLKDCYKSIVEMRTDQGIVVEHWNPNDQKSYLFIKNDNSEKLLAEFESSSKSYDFLSDLFSRNSFSYSVVDNFFEVLDGSLVNFSSTIHFDNLFYVNVYQDKKSVEFSFQTLNQARVFALKKLSEYLTSLARLITEEKSLEKSSGKSRPV